ncbi:MAG: hypothetical protein ACRC8Y_20965, partial [Chroococcales cyanobacterium]
TEVVTTNGEIDGLSLFVVTTSVVSFPLLTAGFVRTRITTEVVTTNGGIDKFSLFVVTTSVVSFPQFNELYG